MAKSKSKSKKNGNSNNSSAKNIKALIAQNKMIENQNAEAMREAEEKRLAREAEKEAKAQQQAEAENAAAREEPIATAEADEVIVDTTVADQPEAMVNADAGKGEKKDGKKDDKDKKKGKKNKKQREGLGKKVKDTASELKKVTWPSFKEVVKKTGIVFAVVIFFAVILLAFDFLMSLLYKLFIS